MGMNLTMAGDYAIRAMIHLGSLPEEVSALRTEIAESEQIPTNFMAKILRRLVQAGLLRSSRGVNGGFILARPTDEITMLEIVEAVEGPISLTRCATERMGCERADECPASLVWPEVQRAMKDVLDRTSLECLVSAPRRNGKILRLPGHPISAVPAESLKLPA